MKKLSLVVAALGIFSAAAFAGPSFAVKDQDGKTQTASASKADHKSPKKKHTGTKKGKAEKKTGKPADAKK